MVIRECTLIKHTCCAHSFTSMHKEEERLHLRGCANGVKSE